MAEFKLRLQLQEDVEKTVRVNRDEFVVGRLPICDLYLPFLEISRHHSRFVKIAINSGKAVVSCSAFKL
ncbi:hypothetical protein [Allocoleopsis franciscana]|uniref:FHA domain-containing protein n=1 Tax=Allocoleopsis franciscana PCC 7113 TaxID=1173027 RepID=K9WEK2_9CYAN|nr:hypothetical protein [Allocoleopsis franciscana]AFZ18189.1 hypothetical protein Mic7113_2385 [Allocoleopsis franciscana PCC 7113]